MHRIETVSDMEQRAKQFVLDVDKRGFDFTSEDCMPEMALAYINLLSVIERYGLCGGPLATRLAAETMSPFFDAIPHKDLCLPSKTGMADVLDHSIRVVYDGRTGDVEQIILSVARARHLEKLLLDRNLRFTMSLSLEEFPLDQLPRLNVLRYSNSKETGLLLVEPKHHYEERTRIIVGRVAY